MTRPPVQTERDRVLAEYFGEEPVPFGAPAPSRFPDGWTAAELVATDFPEPRWAVPGLVAEGLTLLAGAPKLGKSWLALNIAVAVALGGRALGCVPVEAGEAVYLALEDPGRRLKDRLKMVLDGGVAPPGLHLFPQWPLLHDGGLDLLNEWLGEHPSTRLIVVDVFARIRGRTAASEDRYSADYAQMVGLKEVADRHGVAVVVVHHTRKAASEDFLDLVSGTNGLAGAADTILVLARSRGSADAKLHITGRDVEEAEHALKLAAGRWTLLEGPASDYELGDTRRRILDLIRERGPHTPKQVADSLGLDHSLTRQTCKRMADATQLDVTNGTYSLPVTPVTQSLSQGSDRGDMSDSPLDFAFGDPREAA